MNVFTLASGGMEIFMDCFYARGTLSTNKTSDEYISVNNFGYYKGINQNICVKRQKGRVDFQIIYLDKGYGHFWINNSFVKVPEGSIVILYPGEKNYYEFPADSLADYYWIHFTGSGVTNLLENLKLENGTFKIGDFFEFKEIIAMMSKGCISEDFTTEPFLSSCVFTLLTKTSRKFYIHETPINNVLVRMQNENMNTFKNATYAQICGLSEYHFIRVFKKVTGLTPHKYMAKITADKAIELLSTTNLNVSEIAHLLGFEDSLYFSRFFKKEIGVSPKKYLTSIIQTSFNNGI